MLSEYNMNLWSLSQGFTETLDFVVCFFFLHKAPKPLNPNFVTVQSKVMIAEIFTGG